MPVFKSLLNQVAAIKVSNFFKKEIPTQVFFCEYCEILKKAYFKENLWTAAPE